MELTYPVTLAYFANEPLVINGQPFDVGMEVPVSVLGAYANDFLAGGVVTLRALVDMPVSVTPPEDATPPVPGGLFSDRYDEVAF